MPALNYADALHIGGREVDAVHLDGHRVYPLPPPFMEATLGNVTTPDLPADAVNGDVRIRAKLRVNSLTMTGGAAMVAMQRAAGAADLLFDWRATNTGGMDWRWSTTGTNYAHGPITHPAGTIVVGTDQWLGASRTVQGTTTHYYGEVSTDEGATWQTITDNTAGSMTPFNSASPITVGGVPSGYGPLPGRIYWAQLEAINRARLIFPGVVGNYLTVPSSPALDAPNDLEIVLRLAPTDWRSSILQRMLSRYSSGTNNAAWTVQIQNGYLAMLVVPAGGTYATAQASVVIPYTGSTPAWVKATRRASDGRVQFFHAADAPTEPATWTQLGTDRPGPVGALNTTTAPVMLGGYWLVGDSPYSGRIARAILRNAIGGPAVLDVNENDAAKMATASTFVATSGQTVTVFDTSSGAALIGTVGTVSTPDPGVLPATFTIVARTRHADNTGFPQYAAQTEGTDPRSWYVYRTLTNGRWYMDATPDGVWANRVSRFTNAGEAIPPFGVDVTTAVTVETNRAGRFVMTPRTYNAATGAWTAGTAYDSGATVTPFDVTTVLRVGGGFPAGSRVLSAELRTGTDPTGGTLVWRFDASERTGTGTTYTDPRGRVWTLTAANVIAPKVAPIVQPQAPAVIWRFDASEWPPDATTLTDPRGRAWTATASPIHPASQPDREVA